MAKMTKWHYCIGVVLMALTGALVFMWFDTTPPYEFDADKSYVIPQKAEEGMQIRVVWKVKKLNRFCPGTNLRTLFDPVTKVKLAIYDPVPVAARFELGEDSFLIRTFLLPKELIPGKVGYRATQSYVCNPLQHFWPLVVTTPDLFFEIVEHAGR